MLVGLMPTVFLPLIGAHLAPLTVFGFSPLALGPAAPALSHAAIVGIIVL